MRRAIGMLLLALALVACTDGGPTPEPTARSTSVLPTAPTTSDPETPSAPRVAVVVAPTPAPLAAAAQEGLEMLAALPGGADEVRYATADEAVFVLDLVTFFTEEGYDLVCAIGDGALDAVRRVAETAPGTRFCATPARGDDLPGNVMAIDIRVEELAYLAAVAAANAAPDTAIGIVPARSAYALNRVEVGAQQGLADQGSDGSVLVAAGTADEEEAGERALELFAQGASTVLALWGVDGHAVLSAAEVQPEPTEPASPSPEPTTSPTVDPPPRLVIGGNELRPEPVDGETEEPEFDERVLATIEVRPVAAIRIAIERLLVDWSVEPASIGVAQEALDVVASTTTFGRRVAAAVESAREGIISGEVTVLP